MPLNFAFLGINRASQVLNPFPKINHWAVGGHSLGGAMAAEFAKDNAHKINGLAWPSGRPIRRRTPISQALIWR